MTTKTHKELIDAIFNKNHRLIIRWIEEGLVNNHYVEDLWHKIHPVGRVKFSKPVSRGMSNPCGEIPLAEAKECVVTHPTARVSHKMLLIG